MRIKSRRPMSPAREFITIVVAGTVLATVWGVLAAGAIVALRQMGWL